MIRIKSKLIYLFATGVLFLVPALYVMVSNQYIAGVDESIQFNAAFRFINGQGLTDVGLGNDLSVSNPFYISNWPPGYSLIISLFLKAGLSLDLAAKMLKISFTLIGIFLWVLFSTRIIKSTWFQVLFIAIICRFYVQYLGFYVSDFIIFSLFPLALIYYANINFESDDKIIRKLFCLGSIISLMIFFKYTSLVVALIFGLNIIFSNRKDIKKALAYGFYYSILPLVVYGFVFILNKYLTTSGTLVSSFLGGECTMCNLKNFFFCITGFTNHIMINTFSIIIPLNKFFKMPAFAFTIITFFIILIIWIKITRDSYHSIAKIFIISLFSSFVFFGVLSIIIYQKFGDYEWWPLIEVRYYCFLIPLFALYLFSYLELFLQNRFMRWLIRITASFLIVYCLYYIANTMRYKNEELHSAGSDYFAGTKVLEQIKDNNKTIRSTITFAFYSFSQLKLTDRFNVHPMLCLDIKSSLHEKYFSVPTLVFFVYKPFEIEKAPSFQQMISIHNLKKENTETDVEVYWAIFDNTIKLN